ncbi:MAG: hypothetical protein ACHQM6_04205 [Candidatus Kapaibacterium sp.]
MRFLTMTLLFTFLFSSDSLLAQKKKKKITNPKSDAVTIDTLNALIARHEWQFPIRSLWDDALLASQKSHRPVLAFNVDYVDVNSMSVREKLLRDPEVMIYLTKNFELALDDFSVDPPPSVGFDSLNHLGTRLDGLEKGYNIVSRPTAILLRPDSSEIERIPNLQNYSSAQFIKITTEYLRGMNTVAALRNEFWSDPKNLDKHKKYLDRMMERFDYDSILYHYHILATDPNFGQTLQVMKDAAAEYAYLRFKQEGNVPVLKHWLGTLDRHADSSVIIAGLRDLLEHYQATKKIDSIAVYYHAIFTFSGERDPDLLNNFAWDITNLCTGYDSAMTYVNEAIATDARNPNYYDTRALIENNKKDYDAAISDAHLAVKYGKKEDKDYFKERLEYYENQKKKTSPANNKE